MTEAMTRDQQMCATVGHSWDEFTPFNKERPERGTVRFSLRCVRCTKERHDLIDLHGALISRRYEGGYQRGRGDGRLTREELRVMLLSRRISASRQKRKAS